ncbi:protein-glutamate O-methyltransferase CheR [Paenibacillus motobuensis]|uniref:CheR family methyltransferase n=1 Tax=Paenibacillus TaxID=44249 RepID=UPI00203BCDF4|nr:MULTISPECIES: protein-glutamate O-methyltransferase CheR [Paenibacillus]MCM3040150.1 protein-glutamate O-methyltransferase CheR [Paenibacillus lutimineralis]MCM3647254.1 protein-glutamate O-methyltransferase CheR [Paenibacillus motobuensis]
MNKLGFDTLQTEPSDHDAADYAGFIQNVKKSTGIDLAQYKEAQMKRRLTTLRNKNGYSSFTSFFKAMMENKTLFYEFLDKMTINVSEFWRNPNRWEVLRDKVLPVLSNERSRMRIWSAACSTGEEPYTLAMILADQGLLQSTYLLATDIDEGALSKAAQGLYLERSLKDVPADVSKRYFTQDGMMYRFDEGLKKHVTFKKQNLLADSFEDGFDLIVCRNVMIYFTEEAKHDLYHKFARSLRPGGVLFVGSTEQIFSPGQYDLETSETFFYRKKA